MTVRRFLVLSCLSLFAAFASPANAQDADEAARLEEIERLRAQKARDAAALRNRTDAAEGALRRLQSSLVDLAGELQAAEVGVTASEEKLASLTQEAETLTERLLRRRRAIGDVLGALQMLERGRPPALLVSPEDANKAAVAAIALRGVTPELAAEARRLAGDLDRIDVVRGRAERERRLLSEAESALGERRRLLEDTLAERERRQAADVTRLRRIEAEDVALAREADSLRALIEGVYARAEAADEEPSAVRADFRATAPSPSLPSVYASLPANFSAARARLPVPAAGRFVQRFGDAVAGGGRAQDLTIRTRPNAIVTAPFGGTVRWARPYGALGNVVILDVGEGYTVVLIGFGRFDVRRGDVVAAGTPLGAMPGQSPALRFYLRQGDRVIDPEPWLLSDAGSGRR